MRTAGLTGFAVLLTVGGMVFVARDPAGTEEVALRVPEADPAPDAQHAKFFSWPTPVASPVREAKQLDANLRIAEIASLTLKLGLTTQQQDAVRTLLMANSPKLWEAMKFVLSPEQFTLWLQHKEDLDACGTEAISTELALFLNTESSETEHLRPLLLSMDRGMDYKSACELYYELAAGCAEEQWEILRFWMQSKCGSRHVLPGVDAVRLELDRRAYLRSEGARDGVAKLD